MNSLSVWTLVKNTKKMKLAEWVSTFDHLCQDGEGSFHPHLINVSKLHWELTDIQMADDNGGGRTWTANSDHSKVDRTPSTPPVI